MSKQMHPMVSLALLGAVGVAMYACHEYREHEAAIAQKEVAAFRQEREAQRKANPRYGPGGVNNRFSSEIAKKGALSGYVRPNTNIDTLVHSGERRNQPAPMSGVWAGQTHPGDLGNTLIEDKKYIGDRDSVSSTPENAGGTPSNAPRKTKVTPEKDSKSGVQINYDRYRDSSGR
ncbi:MAG: hypothetical protein IKV03_05380 [Alphaproteobacteria bacterium]|nr:hypothetical protein [Alphaproteobacteria bacterium]